MAIDWTKLYQGYKGLWVALAQDEETVIASGKTVKEALDQARKNGCPQPILTRLPDRLVAYVGFGL